MAHTSQIKRLRTLLNGFDGRSNSVPLQAIEEFSEAPQFEKWLVQLCSDSDERVSGAASWCLKHLLETGKANNVDWFSDLSQDLQHINDWSAQLHLCQCVQFADLSQVKAKDIEHWRDWLEPLHTSNRPMIRAWSLDAVCCLAIADKRIVNRARVVHKRALEDDAASVRARARKWSAKIG